MFHWIHHLFNPHCLQCQAISEDNRVCQSCETLRMQLSIANIEKKQLLESILSLNHKPEPEPQTPINYESLKPQMMTWKVRKQMLEAEDRKAAQLIAEQSKKSAEIAKLEKEVGISEEVKSDA